MAKRIAFLNDTSSWYHWGCTGTSTAIKEVMAERGYEVTPIPIQSIYACEHKPQTVADFDDPQFFNRFFHGNLAVTGPILQSDIVVINGEGSIHGLSPIAVTLLYLAYTSKKICHKQVQIINHSCYPNSGGSEENPSVNAIYQGVYKLLDFVAVREERSQEILKGLGIESTLSFDCLPLYISKHALLTSERSKAIVIAGSVAWREQGIASLASYIKKMMVEGYQIQVLTGAKADPAQDDALFIQMLKKAMADGWTHIDAASMKEWLTTIKSAQLLVSGRFHYTIAACMLDTPCIVLESNTPKNAALTKDAGLNEPLSYHTEHLDAVLYDRSRSLLQATPYARLNRNAWLERAMKNFVELNEK